MITLYRNGADKVESFSSSDLESITFENGMVKVLLSTDYTFETPVGFEIRSIFVREAEEFVRKFDLSKLISVTVDKPDISAYVLFKFSDGLEFTVTGAFNIGFYNNGPKALHDILEDAGFKNADGVYREDITTFEGIR